MINPEGRDPTINFTQEKEKYTDLFERVERSNIVPDEEKPLNLESLEECLDETFREYGEKSIRDNNGKILMSLSGGLDSTVFLSFARKNFPEAEIETFTLGGSENHPDIIHARLASEKFKTKHNEFIPTPEEIQEGLIDYNETFSKDSLEESVKMGDFDCFLLYNHIKHLSESHPKNLIACDGIDELMGGYWDHRKSDDLEIKRESFIKHWENVVPGHLKPLVRTADNFNINLLFPYLDDRVIKEISKISLNDRTFEKIGKKPLKAIAEKMGIPKEIIERPKEGFVGATKREKEDRK